jgi:hypothetical protein
MAGKAEEALIIPQKCPFSKRKATQGRVGRVI